ncbi:MAG: hypothetical protein MUC71_14180 [Steroidobacteraceae bacterium]|jgi:hypothetical protein|nr:hypothetical protein [Steroidobacteraceae bacterium]
MSYTRTRLPMAALAFAALAGCGSYRAYEGPALPRAELARVQADPAFSAGLPVQVVLRKVDDREVPVSRSAVELPPGRHAFIVDCRLAETGSTTRFTIEAEVDAGADYRLEAEATAVGCERVELRRR